MHPSITLGAVLALWSELPQLVGPEAWGELCLRLEVLLRRLRLEDDPRVQAALAKQMLELLRARPEVRPRFDRLLRQASDQHRKTRGRPAVSAIGDEDLPALAVIRHTDISAPRALELGRRGVVTVGLTRRTVGESEVSEALELRTGRLEVYLHSPSAVVEILGEPFRRLQVMEEGDTEPAVFYIVGRRPGSSTLVLDFRQQGVSVGEARLIVEVRDRVELDESQTAIVSTTLTQGADLPQAADLDLRVFSRKEAGGATRLDYMLHSPNGRLGFHYQPIPGLTLERSPEDYQRYLIHKIEKLSRGQDVDGHPLPESSLPDHLAALGQQLYHELFSDSLRSAYRQIRNTTRTIQITSDEPWIPWELIKPYDDSDPHAVIDDDFLCVRYQLTRWLAGRSGPAAHVPVAAFACVEAARPPGKDPLPHVDEERGWFAMLAASDRGLRDLSPSPASASAVGALLDQGEVDLWHFAAHGNANLAQPNESLIVLADGVRLRPDSISGPRQSRVARRRPLVFLNVCRVAQQGWGLSRLGGWVSAWVGRARCGSFIGPLWCVDDELAYHFARAFYEHLRQGRTLGQAALEARLHVRDLRPTNPTWLAYSVYGHPNGRVTL